MPDAKHLLRHFLASLAYRFQKSVAGASESFSELEAGHGIRTPLAIVHHINGVLGYGRKMLEDDVDADYWYYHPRLDWTGEVTQIHAMLRSIDDFLRKADTVEAERLERLLQGPLSDAMTHVGQLATLRRIAGDPLPSENFYKAAIRAGQVSTDQPDPVNPD